MLYRIFLLCLLLLNISACATYERKSLSFKPPTEYLNYRDIAGVQVGGEAYADRAGGEEVFGFDIIKAGILPVQVVIDNKSGDAVEVVTGQTFLIDDTNRYWKLLSARDAVDRVQRATEAGWITSGAGRGAAWGAAAGALLGLAIGIASGHDIGGAIIKGGVLGGAGGAVIGGSSKSGEKRKLEYQIVDDLREKGLEGKQLGRDALASGFIFFPAEAKTAKELRLQLLYKSDNSIKTVNLRFK